MTDGAPFRIAFEDEHLLVVDKAAGVVVHPGRGHREDTLAQLLAPGSRAGSPSGPASSIASTATPPACSWWPVRRRSTGACSGRCRSG